MFIRIRIAPNATGETPKRKPRSYPLRGRSFVLSLCVHAAVVFLLASIKTQPVPSRRPIYDEFVKPESSKIIFYDFRKKAPDVSPVKKVGTSPRPTGEEISKQTAIATSPNPKSKEQFVYIAEPKIELRQDTPLPNLVQKIETSLPKLPAPPKEKPRAFVPPPLDRSPKIPSAVPLVDTPAPAAAGRPDPKVPTLAAQVPVLPGPPKEKPRAFVPPPVDHTPKLPIAVPLVDTPAPSAAGRPDPKLPTLATQVPVLPGPPKEKPRAFVPPPADRSAKVPTAVPLVDTPAPSGVGRVDPTPSLIAGRLPSLPNPAPPAPNPSPGNARADVAVASLHPSETVKNELPAGDRPAEFSRAPEKGKASSGDLAAASVTVPNLTVRSDKTPPERPPIAAGGKTIIYAERLRNVPMTTFSVPLRPASRTIPFAIDRRFQGRNVYTVVVPIENLPAYGGDWIVWFAELSPVAGSTPVIKAPVPVKKVEPVEPPNPGPITTARIQLAGSLGIDGHLSKLSVLSRAAPAIEQAAIQDAESWEFKPASRDGMPVSVDVVIEIPFNLPANLAQRTTP